MSGQRRFAQLVPKFASESEMEKDAIEQMRARIKYQKETMGHAEAHLNEEKVEQFRWLNMTFLVGMPVCLAWGIYCFLFDEHSHRDDGELPEYMKVRNKEFPWDCSECDLVDLECWQKCKAAAK